MYFVVAFKLQDSVYSPAGGRFHFPEDRLHPLKSQSRLVSVSLGQAVISDVQVSDTFMLGVRLRCVTLT